MNIIRVGADLYRITDGDGQSMDLYLAQLRMLGQQINEMLPVPQRAENDIRRDYTSNEPGVYQWTPGKGNL